MKIHAVIIKTSVMWFLSYVIVIPQLIRVPAVTYFHVWIRFTCVNVAQPQSSLPDITTESFISSISQSEFQYDCAISITGLQHFFHTEIFKQLYVQFSFTIQILIWCIMSHCNFNIPQTSSMGLRSGWYGGKC